MHLHFLDPYQHRHSLLHALDARVKFVLALGLILTISLLPVSAWAAYVLVFALILSLEIASLLGVARVLKRSALALPFVMAALPLILTAPGPVLLSLPFGWAISAAGVERFASIALKSWLSVQVAILLATTTPFPDLLMAMRAVRIPRLFVAMVGLMWRYLFVLADEALRLLRARAARSGESGQPGLKTGGSLPWRAGVAGGMAGNLFLRGIERSDRIYNAMLARGYDGETRALPLPPVSRSSWLTLGAGLLLFAALLFLGALVSG
ncbi:MAG: cobalt ECF transporter T component CbiQ [Chloroflexota bacterium]